MKYTKLLFCALFLALNLGTIFVTGLQAKYTTSQSSEDSYSIIVEYINTLGTDVAPYRKMVDSAIAFWSPIATIIIADEYEIQSTSPFIWEYKPRDERILTIVISNEPIVFGDTHTIAFYDGYAAYISTAPTISTYPYDTTLPAAIAHELGHLVFNLPDFYLEGCTEIDIMCQSNGAYHVGFIGCKTRAYLDLPCPKIFLPELE